MNNTVFKEMEETLIEEYHEIECFERDCSKVALWKLVFSKPCEHAIYCQSHKDHAVAVSEESLQNGDPYKWGCTICGYLRKEDYMRLVNVVPLR